jgi:hypothetical protein
MAGGLLFRLVQGWDSAPSTLPFPPPTGRPQPIQFAGFISNLTNSNGCGNLWAKVADSVPVSSLLSPATRRVSATLRSPDHSVPAPNTSLPAFSSTYKSLSSHHRFASLPLSADYKPLFSQPLYFLIDTKPRGCRGISAWLFTSHRSRVTSHVLSFGCRLFQLSLRSFSHSLPFFSTVCSLFCENTRVGGRTMLAEAAAAHAKRQNSHFSVRRGKGKMDSCKSGD